MLASIINLVNKNELSQMQAKKILYKSMDIKKDPIEIVKEMNLKQITDENLLLKYVKEVISENEKQVQEYYDGKEYVVNYFIGKMMIKTNKQANPNITLSLIKKELERMKNE